MKHNTLSTNGRPQQMRWLNICFAWLCIGSQIATADDRPLDFVNDALPSLKQNCIACHNTQKAEGGLNLETHELLMKGGDSGAAIVAGKSAESLLLKHIIGETESIMPPDGNAVGAKRLTPDEINRLKAWIDSGAIAGDAKKAAAMQWRPIAPDVRPIYAMAATSDGQSVAVGRANQVSVYRWPSLDGAADVWPLIDPAVQSELGGKGLPATHLDLIQSIAFSPDSMRIATGGYRDVKIWKRVTELSQDASVAAFQNTQFLTSSSDGNVLARVGKDNVIEVFDANSFSKWMRIETGTQVTGIALSVDAKRLAVSFANSTLQLYAVQPPADGQTIANSPATHSQTLEVPLSAPVILDDANVAGITPDRHVQVWKMSIATPEAPAQLQKQVFFAEDADVVSIARSLEGTPRLCIAKADGSIKIANPVDGSVPRVLQHGAPLSRIAVANDQARLASVGNDGITKVWNSVDGSMISESKNDYEQLKKTQWAERLVQRQQSRVDRMAAKIPELEKAKQAETEAKDKLQTVRNQAAETVTKKQMELEASDKAITDAETAVAMAKQAVEEAMKKVEQTQKELEAKKEMKKVAEKAKKDADEQLAKFDKTLAVSVQAVQRATEAIPQFQASVDKEKESLAGLQMALATTTAAAQQPAPPAAIAFASDSKSIVTSHANGTIRVARADKGIAQASIQTGSPTSAHLAVTRSGRVLLVFDDGQVKTWNISNQWNLERTIGNAGESPWSDRVTAMDFSPDGQFIAIGSGPPSRFGELKTISVTDGSIAKDFGQIHSDTILAVKYSPDGNSIATAAADKIIRIHKTTGEFVKPLEGHTHHVLSLAWHDDGVWLASASADNTVKVWDTESGQSLRTIAGFGKEVTSISFVGRTNQIFTSSADQQSRLHDASNGGLIRAFGGAADAIYCNATMGATPVGVAGGQDGKLWIWQLDNGQALQQLQ